jgi:hypothetical protein
MKSRAEKAVFWIGSLSGIIVSIFTFYEKVTEPGAPKLIVKSFESSSDMLRLVPSIDTRIEETEHIPLQLVDPRFYSIPSEPDLSRRSPVPSSISFPGR